MSQYNDCIYCEEPFWVAEGNEWKTMCFSCWKIHGRKRGRPRKPAAPQIAIVYEPDLDGQWLRDNIKDLIRLCHPDKHGGSPVSNEITKRLISRYREERRKQRCQIPDPTKPD